MLACTTFRRGNAHVQRRPTHGSGSQLGEARCRRVEAPALANRGTSWPAPRGCEGSRHVDACSTRDKRSITRYIFDVKDCPRYPRFGGDLRRKVDGPQSVRPDVSFGRCRKRSTRRCKRGSEVVLNPQHFPSVLRHSPRCLQSALRALLLSKPSRLAALGISHEPGNDKR